MLLSIIITLMVVGILMYIITTFVPMEQRIKQLMVVVVILILALWVLQELGLLGSIQHIAVH